MSAESEPKEVFISHSSKDADKAKEICCILEEKDVRCWMAPRDVPAGGSYGKEIMKAIRGCNIFLLLVSQNANVSEHVTTEIEIAFDAKKVIIPFMLEDVIYPEEIEYFLRRKQRIDAFKSFEDSLNNLVKAIGIHVKSIDGEKLPTASPAVMPTQAPSAKGPGSVAVTDENLADEASSLESYWFIDMIDYYNICVDYKASIKTLTMVGE